MLIFHFFVVHLERLLPVVRPWHLLDILIKLEFSECLGAFRVMGNLSDAVKQDLVLLVQSCIENLSIGN